MDPASVSNNWGYVSQTPTQQMGSNRNPNEEIRVTQFQVSHVINPTERHSMNENGSAGCNAKNGKNWMYRCQSAPRTAQNAHFNPIVGNTGTSFVVHVSIPTNRVPQHGWCLQIVGRTLMTPLIFDSCITMPKQARLSWTPLFVSGWVT